MSLKLITAPTVEPVTLAEAKLHCRVDAADDDALITALIVAARIQAENRTSRALITQTWELALDIFPDGIEMPLPPVQSIASVKYLDTSGVEQTLANTEYLLDSHSQPGWLVPAYGKSWPETYAVPNAVKVQFTAGYGAAAAVPQAIKQWMLLQIGHWYENRESVSLGTVNELPYVDALLDPYRVIRFL